MVEAGVQFPVSAPGRIRLVEEVVCEATSNGFNSHTSLVIVNSTKKVVYTSSQFTMADLRKIVEDNKYVADSANVKVNYYSGYNYGESSRSTIEIVEI